MGADNFERTSVTRSFLLEPDNICIYIDATISEVNSDYIGKISA